jgi:hypothetical protein
MGHLKNPNKSTDEETTTSSNSTGITSGTNNNENDEIMKSIKNLKSMIAETKKRVDDNEKSITKVDTNFET